jgi:hypothetical protein
MEEIQYVGIIHLVLYEMNLNTIIKPTALIW